MPTPIPVLVHRRARRRGAALLIVALSAATLCGLLAIVVDLGVARLAREQLQAGTDAAALNGVRRLDGSASGLAAARATATEVATTNRAFNEHLAVDANAANSADGDVVIGHWDADASVFEPTVTPEDANAMLVRTRRDDLESWFARILGRDQMAASAMSIATQGPVVGAGRVPWYLPFALPLCQVEGRSDQQLLDMTLVLSPATGDVVGWGAIEANPSASWARGQIDAALECMHEWDETGTVEESCTEASVGDSVKLGNGSQAGSLNYLSDAMGRGLPWDSERWGALPPQHAKSSVPTATYGMVLEGAIPIFSGGDGYCTSTASWNETLPVVGFVWGVIYDVAKGNASQRNVWIRLDVSHVYDLGSWSGGVDYGVTWNAAPVLVW